ncbi:MAG TPA: hypothetical protein VE136_00830 [Anaerolineales bacterium]|jgi:hypothetical protein|nr:hypothetical protein [Anaerolineales bacterium]
MAYSYKNSRGVTYFLHARKRALKSGKEQVLYFFSKEKKEGVLNSVPTGYEVSETPNGLPVLKRSGTHGSGGGP